MSTVEVAVNDGEGSSGISGDAIALAVTGILGIASFVMQGRHAATAREHAAEQERQAQQAEREKERIHQRTQAQFQRTDRWLDECCRPIFTLLVAMSQSRVNNVIRFVHMLERTNPDVVAAMVSLERRDKKIMGGWGSERQFFSADNAPDLQAQLTRFSTGAYQHPGAGSAADAIGFPDHITPHQQPSTAELPQPMLDYVAAEPTSDFAYAYRSYVRFVLVPRLDKIAEIIEAHGAYIEYPPMSYFKERFPGDANWDFCELLLSQQLLLIWLLCKTCTSMYSWIATSTNVATIRKTLPQMVLRSSSRNGLHTPATGAPCLPSGNRASSLVSARRR